jgi:Vitamin K-dependent gamma-carboxylase
MNKFCKMTLTSWDHFWFGAIDGSAKTVASIRILSGSLFVYSQISSMSQISGFYGSTGWSSLFYNTSIRSPFNASLLPYLTNQGQFICHVLSILIGIAYTIGFKSKYSSPMTWITHLTYLNANESILFGFDHVLNFILLYLCIGASNQTWSIDHVLQKEPLQDSIFSQMRNTVCLRLVQIHICMVYVSSGIGKWNANWIAKNGLWNALHTTELQNFNLGWLTSNMTLINLASYATVFFEIFFVLFVWPRRTRPFVIGSAFLLHLGIALTMRLTSFSVVMVTGCLAFVNLNRRVKASTN